METLTLIMLALTLSKLISYVKLSRVVLIWVSTSCVCVCVSCQIMSLYFPLGTNIKIAQPGIYGSVLLQKLVFLLPPLPKQLPALGLPKSLVARRLVEGQESANQGRPGSPAFRSPGRLQKDLRRNKGSIDYLTLCKQNGIKVQMKLAFLRFIILLL